MENKLENAFIVFILITTVYLLNIEPWGVDYNALKAINFMP